MAPVRKPTPPTAPPPEQDVFPASIVVDDDAFAQISARVTSPREPSAALRDLFKK